MLVTKLGIATTGYHDDSPSDRALAMTPVGGWNEYLEFAEPAELTKYEK